MEIKVVFEEEILKTIIIDALANSRFDHDLETNNSKLYTKKQVSEKLGISMGKLEKLVRTQQLSKIQLGKSVRFSEVDIIKLINRHRRG